MKQSRWKSYVLWVTLAALIFWVVKNWIGFEIPGWDQFVTLLLGLAVALGIINNPTDSVHI
jgi:uncharacterized membrane protein